MLRLVLLAMMVVLYGGTAQAEAILTPCDDGRHLARSCLGREGAARVIVCDQTRVIHPDCFGRFGYAPVQIIEGPDESISAPSGGGSVPPVVGGPTGRAKTVRVKQYERKDGTRVKAYDRAPPKRK
jgi:hypothetical protein